MQQIRIVPTPYSATLRTQRSERARYQLLRQFLQRFQVRSYEATLRRTLVPVVRTRMRQTSVLRARIRQGS